MAGSKWVFSRSFYAMLFCVGVATFVMHEFAHWLTGVALGHEMMASPNRVWPRSPVSPGDQGLITAAGPLITIAQGVIGYGLVMRRASLLGFALLYMAFYMRLLAAALSISNPNDEARLSLMLGLGTWTLPLAVVGSLFGLVLLASRQLRLRFRDQFACFWVAAAVVTFMVGLDAAFWRGRQG